MHLAHGLHHTQKREKNGNNKIILVAHSMHPHHCNRSNPKLDRGNQARFDLIRPTEPCLSPPSPARPKTRSGRPRQTLRRPVTPKEPHPGTAKSCQSSTRLAMPM
eukprot:TRINITY_DN66079_c0_g1_i1.p1 TRINITY_DN66079_c0_g1~~TRINITY_DN66079_c0_g1_i1.p1  ORF type:complete len:105 (-),score=9.75 TRINITY_DN66079_c0_g1_i1:7-321(-)